MGKQKHTHTHTREEREREREREKTAASERERKKGLINSGWMGGMLLLCLLRLQSVPLLSCCM